MFVVWGVTLRQRFLLWSLSPSHLSLAAHTPSGAQLFMPAAMGQGSALVVPLFDKLSKLPDPRKVPPPLADLCLCVFACLCVCVGSCLIVEMIVCRSLT